VPGVVRRLLLTIALFLPVAVLFGTPSPAGAADGLSVTSTTTFTVDAAAGAVRVRGEFHLVNTLPDQVDGTTVRRRYFSGFTVPGPAASANAIAVTAGGGGLRVTRRPVPGATDYVLYDIAFASDLFYRDTADVVLTYDITGNPPRSDNPIRVNAAYAAFGAFGIGDEGEVTVRVVVPDGFEVDVLGSDTQVSHENGTTVYTATDIADPQQFDLFISARNDEALVSTQVTTDGGDRFDVRSWPGDDEWQQFVADLIRSGVPSLESLVGRPWPIDSLLEIRQAYTPYLYGYAGWFSASKREIEVGEDLDQEVVLHELSHAWFSDAWFADRWINEGLAQVYAGMVVAQGGGTPTVPTPIDQADPGVVALNDWGDPDFTNGADAREPYGYNTAQTVVQQIVDEVGVDHMREVLAAVDARTIAYVGDAPPEVVDTATDWRRFLDLVDEVGGATTADDLIERYVVNTDQAPMLAPRAAAREAYAALVTNGAEWAPPIGVRRRMSEWEFDRATDLMSQSQDVLATRDTLDGLAAELAVEYPDSLEAAYESADDDLSTVTDQIQAQIDATQLTIDAAAANAEDHGWFEVLGLRGTDLPALLDQAKVALATGDLDTASERSQRVIDTVADSSSVGLQRAALAAGALALVVSLAIGITLLTRRRRTAVPLDTPDTLDSPDDVDAPEDAGSDAITPE
jgi:hypothetical protein